jgi:TPP-dependent pyruvate/acetoin dehydrogenase alpha subunit
MNSKDLTDITKKFLRIRFFEDSLDYLFLKQKIFGTYHRCIGQELVAISLTYYLDKKNDYVVSNHRNHGHYLAFKEKYADLLYEIKGDPRGSTSGNGGSQVICDKNFFSNGIIGSTIPLAAGIAFGIKQDKSNNCVVCFIGDGAMGSGLVYESFNLSSIFNLPIIFVIEDNKLAQSTHTTDTISGNFIDKFNAFNIECAETNDQDIQVLLNKSKEIISLTKNNQKPYGLVVRTNRLCAHSKGDEYENRDEILFGDDPLINLKKMINNDEEFKKIEKDSKDFIKSIVAKI